MGTLAVTRRMLYRCTETREKEICFDFAQASEVLSFLFFNNFSPWLLSVLFCQPHKFANDWCNYKKKNLNSHILSVD